MTDLLLDQFVRLLDGLSPEDPWPAIIESGFLDLLRPEAEGGGGARLEDLFPLAVETGRRAQAPGIVETMAARLVQPDAVAIQDPEALVGRPLAAMLAAAQMSGAIWQVNAMTIEYATMRKQFGREIGRFQAVQHQIALLAEEALAARTAAQAAFIGAPSDASERKAAVAKIRCGQAALTAGAVSHAVHGAIGVSEAHSLHHYTRRLRTWRLAHGGESWWAQKLGDWALGETADITSLARAL